MEKRTKNINIRVTQSEYDELYRDFEAIKPLRDPGYCLSDALRGKLLLARGSEQPKQGKTRRDIA